MRERARARERKREREERERFQGQSRKLGAIGCIHHATANLARILSRFCTRTLLSEMRTGMRVTIPHLLHSRNFQMLHITVHQLSIDFNPTQVKTLAVVGSLDVGRLLMMPRVHL